MKFLSFISHSFCLTNFIYFLVRPSVRPSVRPLRWTPIVFLCFKFPAPMCYGFCVDGPDHLLAISAEVLTIDRLCVENKGSTFFCKQSKEIGVYVSVTRLTFCFSAAEHSCQRPLPGFLLPKYIAAVRCISLLLCFSDAKHFYSRYIFLTPLLPTGNWRFCFQMPKIILFFCFFWRA